MALSVRCYSQIPASDEVYFFIKKGSQLTENSNVWYVIFGDEDIYISAPIKKSVMKEELYRNSDCYVGNKKSTYRFRGTYNITMSTKTREVYRSGKQYEFTPDNTQKMTGYSYCAVSKDKNSIILWKENRAGELDGGKNYFIRIDKQYLMPQRVNYDFLNE